MWNKFDCFLFNIYGNLENVVVSILVGKDFSKKKCKVICVSFYFMFGCVNLQTTIYLWFCTNTFIYLFFLINWIRVELLAVSFYNLGKTKPSYVQLNEGEKTKIRASY